MPNTPQVQKGDRIKMNVSLSGDNISWAPNQVLEVGKHIDETFANALVSEPSDYPRADLLPRDDPPKNDPPKEERKPEMETATSPAAEKRETATPKRRAGKPKPPSEEPTPPSSEPESAA